MIVHLITGLDMGGAECVLASFLEALQPEERKNHRVISLIAPGPVADRIQAVGVDVSSLHMQPGRPTLGALLRLRKNLATTPGWFLHGWMYHANLMASAVCLLTGRPRAHLWAIHNGLEKIASEKPLTRLLIRLGAWISPLPRAIVYVGQRSATQHEALGYARRKRVMIQNGHDLSRYKPDPSARARLNLPPGPVIGHVARWDWTKDHATFLAALANVPLAQAVLIGQGMSHDNADLVALVRAHGVESRVHLLGLRTDVPDLMPGFDVFCLSSRNESLPGVICEAMACGVPCVATDVGDVAEVVGDTGRIVPPENPAALASALRALLADPNRITLGRAARARISTRPDRPAMAQAYRDLYRALGWTG